jgi:S1-C subfamily serine protease
LDSGGRVIGMNSAIPAATGASVGIGFAIPVDTLNRVVPILIRRGQLYRPRMGFGTLADDQAARLGVPRGVVVGEVEAGSPAAKAGLKGVTTDGERITALGDIIVAIDGKRLSSSVEMFAFLEQAEPKDQVILDVLRDGKVERLTVNLKDGAK